MPRFTLEQPQSFHLTGCAQDLHGLHYSSAPVLLDFGKSARFVQQGVDVQPCRNGADQNPSRVQRNIWDPQSPVSSDFAHKPAILSPEGVKIKHCSAYRDDSLVNSNAVISLPQAGGHENGLKLYNNDPTKIIKDTYKLEVIFYEKLAPKLDNALDTHWDGWRAHYHGWEALAGEKNKKELASIILENIAASTSSTEYNPDSKFFWHPNAVDVKLGKNLASGMEVADKKERKDVVSSITTSGTLAMRLTGAAIWDNKRQGYVKIHKRYGHTVDASGRDLEEKFNALFPISDAEGKSFAGSTLSYYAGGLSPRMMQVILNSLIPQFEKLLHHVSEFKWSSPATSVLIIFEGDARRLDKVIQSTSQMSPKISDVRLIDFAYTKEDTKVDEDLVLGLKNTLKQLQNLYRNIEKLHL
ncbi:hypothetical protein PGT21_032030 [Puccinia graminis f. sp. tritici]|uniref:Kinase n=2 Tax=Puccinia graminis f. sp. tritici TaxID=56615 RepID=E3KWU4_PUCGT|nr:uncharacterized protein PGTG_14727 [Puccinia graminis f. sp. tritici CRL 75-36-700-3]EFP88761.2 hypothetical protein PGTG_14727 [Puccinia graminis f. sp. tritici CRL 75-36-700-3]KAA1072820.1 hypothetical protein PGTUg99_016403 [Puccinia graminis f. sp. tritici]KAA1075242.1 hypothetical protein PGT21_032030 [Puccinia graminis f. sp. tritici]